MQTNQSAGTSTPVRPPMTALPEPEKDYLRVRLNDSRQVTIRPVLPSDLGLLRQFFAALSRATLRLRFHSSTNEISEHLLHQLTTVKPRAQVAIVAEIEDSAAGQLATLVAEARFVRSAGSQTAEFALVVADNWRRIGLGTLLTQILAQRARFTGVRRLCGDVLEDNKAMRGFADSLGARWSLPIGRGQTLRLSLEL
jgi:acetyltransferase